MKMRLLTAGVVAALLCVCLSTGCERSRLGQELVLHNDTPYSVMFIVDNVRVNGWVSPGTYIRLPVAPGEHYVESVWPNGRRACYGARVYVQPGYSVHLYCEAQR